MERVKTVGRIFLGMIVAIFVASYVIQLTNLREKNYFLAMLLSQCMLLLPSIIYMWKYKISPKKAIRFNRVSGINIFLCAIFAFLLMPVMSLVNAISLLFSKLMIQQTIQDVVDQYPLVTGVFLIAFIPSIFEETIFRGVLFNESRKWNVGKGIILSAFLFGLAHMNFNQFSYAFIMGIIFALLIEATDSIASTMIVHFIINASSVIITFSVTKLIDTLKAQGFDTEQYEVMTSNAVDKSAILSSLGSYIVLALVTGFCAFFIYRAIAKNANRWEHIKAIFGYNKENLIVDQQTNNETKEFDKLGNGISIPWCLILGITICILEMILAEVLS